MPFKIDTIRYKDKLYSLTNQNISNGNSITFLVGKNGVGKSVILSALAHTYTDRKNLNSKNWGYPEFQTSSESISRPRKVVTQTFSPFSRFPSEIKQGMDLEKYLAKEESNYSSIGFTKNMGFRGSVSRDVIERAIRKLLTEPNHAPPLIEAMKSLGYDSKLFLEFTNSPTINSVIFDSNSEERVFNEILKAVEHVAEKTTLIPTDFRIARELNSKDKFELSTLIIKCIEGIRFKRISRGGARQAKYELELDLKNIEKDEDYLRQLIILMRLGFLRLRQAKIRTNAFQLDDPSFENLSNTINLTETSSGEQQLISSLFGIIAEAENDSLILIDEPELSLHPEWQTRAVDLIERVLNVFRGCHIFIATHSALIAQRAVELNHEVISIGNDYTNNHIVHDRSQISIEETLLDIFGLPVRDSLYASRLILSLVLEGERSPDSKPNILAKLHRLKKIYTGSHLPDRNILNLIKDSIEVLS